MTLLAMRAWLAMNTATARPAVDIMPHAVKETPATKAIIACRTVYANHAVGRGSPAVKMLSVTASIRADRMVSAFPAVILANPAAMTKHSLNASTAPVYRIIPAKIKSAMKQAAAQTAD